MLVVSSSSFLAWELQIPPLLSMLLYYYRRSSHQCEVETESFYLASGLDSEGRQRPEKGRQVTLAAVGDIN